MNTEVEQQVLPVVIETPEAAQARRKKYKRFLIFVIWPMFLLAFLSFAFPKDPIQETLHHIKYTEQSKGKEADNLVYLYNHVGFLYMQKDKPAEAVPYLLHALELSRKVYGPTGIWTIRELHNLGCAYTDLKQFDLAEKYYREAYDRADFDIFTAEQLDDTRNYPLLLMREGKWAEAREYLKRLIAYPKINAADRRRFQQWVMDCNRKTYN